MHVGPCPGHLTRANLLENPVSAGFSSGSVSFTLNRIQALSSPTFIVDSYKNYITDDFIYSCFNSNIYLFFLPLYTLYVFQLFDLSIFGPIKAHYCTIIGNFIYQSNDYPINKRGFLKCYSKARQYSLNEKNVLAGWKVIKL